MIYDLRIDSMRKKFLEDSALEGDDCPVDDICDSSSRIVKYITELEEIIRNYKTAIQKLDADLDDAHRRINNLNSQKARRKKRRR